MGEDDIFLERAITGRIALFKDIFLGHGARGYRDEDSYQRIKGITELDKLRVVPMVFALLPLDAVRPPSNRPIKPIISNHLQAIGITYDEMLLDILKRITDQYIATSGFYPGIYQPRKWGMADLRANHTSYKKILGRQNGRCAVCGKRLGIDCPESLDHVIPFRLLGDVTDGANWQILCERCNRGKSDYISCLQSREALNWIYGRRLDGDLTDEARYVILRRFANCEIEGCTVSARTSALSIVSKFPTGLALPINMKVVCQGHNT